MKISVQKVTPAMAKKWLENSRSIPDEWPETRIKTFGAIRKHYTKTPELRICIITDLKRLITELQKPE